MTNPTICTRRVFAGFVAHRPVSPEDLELPRVRAALRSLLAETYDQGDGPWSSEVYWANRRRVGEAPDVASVYALAGELLLPHEWSTEELQQAFAVLLS